MNKRNPIVIIGGSKGGVGKSLATLAVVDYYNEQSIPVLLVETDTSNPDTAKAARNDPVYVQNDGNGPSVAIVAIDLDSADGWTRLLDVIDAAENRKRAVIINTAARNNEGVSKHGELLRDTLDELQRPLITVWMINSQRDSLLLLGRYRETMTAGAVHVARNLFFGSEDKFDLYNTSETRTNIEAVGGKSINFPDLADRVTYAIYSDRLTIRRAGDKDQPIGHRAELTRWRRLAHAALDEVLRVA